MAVLVVITAILFLGLAIVGLAVRILLKKDGEFPGTCSSNNPLNDDGSCSVCGASSKQSCQNEEK